MKIKYADYLKKTSFTKEELLANTWGTLIEDAPIDVTMRLPGPPLLMVDRVTEIVHDGSKGRIVGEQDIALDDWFFQCHFRADPVQPGCLGVDAIWQLLGLYIAVRGGKGAARALGAKEVDFFGQIRPHNKLVRYEVNVRRYMENASSGASFVIGSGSVSVDGTPIYTVEGARVGSFIGIEYANYPHESDNFKHTNMLMMSNA